MIITATITSRVTRKNFCGLAGSTEYFTVSDPRIGLVPVVDCRNVEVGDVVEFAYVACGNGYRWMMRGGTL